MPIADFTNAEELSVQIRANAILGRILRRALADGLPSHVVWTIGDGGHSITGRCYSVDPGRRLADWERWRTAIGGSTTVDEVVGGERRLAATNERYDGVVLVAVVADVFFGDEGSQ
jgi:hypothetical protein